MPLPEISTDLAQTAAALLNVCVPVPASAVPERERRRERRVETAQAAVVRTVFGGKTYSAVIRDCSPGGLGITVHHRLPVGETIIVEWNHGFLIGVVRHSRPSGSGWITGIQLEKNGSQQGLIAEMVASERKARVEQLL